MSDITSHLVHSLFCRYSKSQFIHLIFSAEYSFIISWYMLLFIRQFCFFFAAFITCLANSTQFCLSCLGFVALLLVFLPITLAYLCQFILIKLSHSISSGLTYPFLQVCVIWSSPVSFKVN